MTLGDIFGQLETEQMAEGGYLWEDRAVVNERLRRCMLRAGLDTETLAETAQVSTKTVERWLRGEVVPYPRTRYRVAAILQEDESYLWPEAVDRSALAGAELVASYPRRSDVPRRLWTELLGQAERNVDLLAFAGLFLTEEHPDWVPLLASRAEAGVRVRLLLGDPDGASLSARDGEHRIGGGVAGRVRAVLGSYQPLAGIVEIRLHDTPLYNSIYRFDDDILVNTHVYGILAAYTPVMRLRRVDGAYFSTYLESFERVWASARPLGGGGPQGRAP
jgi:transcriptional regulator with XRE-family HTH domain